MRKLFLLLISLIILSLTSCSATKNKVSNTHKVNYQVPKTYSKSKSANTSFYTEYSNKLGVTLQGHEDKELIRTIESWIGTPYKYAGNKKSGTDCSGFVGNIFSHVYGKILHRRSRDILLDVNLIKTTQLQAGDLIFFKINGKHKPVSHIGIYIAENKFIHASTHGVMLSSLDENYYKKYFYKVGRVK